MAKSIPAIVTPEVLQWARSLDRITLEEIALKLKVEVAKVEAWENGRDNMQIWDRKYSVSKNLMERRSRKTGGTREVPLDKIRQG